MQETRTNHLPENDATGEPRRGALRRRFTLACLGFSLLPAAMGLAGCYNVHRIGAEAAHVDRVVVPALAEIGILHETALRLHANILDVLSGTGPLDAVRVGEMHDITKRGLARTASFLPATPETLRLLSEARDRFERFDALLVKADAAYGKVRALQEAQDRAVAAFGRESDGLRAIVSASAGGMFNGSGKAAQEARDLTDELFGLQAKVALYAATKAGTGLDALEGDIRSALARCGRLLRRMPAFWQSGGEPDMSGLRLSLESDLGLFRTRAALMAETENLRSLKADTARAEQSLSDHLGTLGDVAREMMMNGRIRQARIATDAEISALLLTVLGLTIAMCIAYRFGRGVLQPLARITEAMRALSSGKLDVEVPEQGRRDEIGAMAEALGVFKRNSRRRVELESLEAHRREENLRAEERARAGEALALQHARFDLALNNMSQGLALADHEGRLTVCNASFAAMFGLPPELTQPGTPMSLIRAHRGASGSIPTDGEEAVPFGEATVIDLPDGRALSLRRVVTRDGGWVSTYEDVTERRRWEARINHMAGHDALTDLPNRTLLRSRLEEGLARSRGDLAVLCLDLDEFKSVNDTMGHPAGDALLRSVSERLSSCIGPGAVVGRLGGDEFAVVACGGGQEASAPALAERIIRAVRKPFQVDGHQINIGTSIGVALAAPSGPGADPDVLLRRADIALYSAKAAGRGRHAVFEEAMEASVRERRALEEDLREAVRLGTFDVHYQPLVSFGDGRVTSFEALLRWIHPVRGPVSPAVFIEAAEQTGLIGALGELVLRRACLDAAAWPEQVNVAVNLSSGQFQDGTDLVDTVRRALADAGLPASRLGLEITESVLLDQSDGTLDTLHRLRGMGVKISLDDFGTHYSSLSYLRKFPFDKLKIDQSFVREMLERQDCAAIVRSVIALGRDLAMTTVAEGIETPEQYEHLRTLGCDQAQGYLFSRPRPVAEVPSLLGLTAEAVALAA